MYFTQIWAVGPHADVIVRVDGTGLGCGCVEGRRFPMQLHQQCVLLALPFFPPALVVSVLSPSFFDLWSVLVVILGLICISTLGDPLMKSLSRTLASVSVECQPFPY